MDAEESEPIDWSAFKVGDVFLAHGFEHPQDNGKFRVLKVNLNGIEVEKVEDGECSRKEKGPGP